MFGPKSGVGIDLGAQRILVCETFADADGVRIASAVALDRRRLGLGADARTVAKAVANAMKEAGMSTRGVVLGVGQQDCMLRYAQVAPVASWRLDLIMKYEVTEVAERMDEPVASDFRVLSLPREPGEDQTVLLALTKEAFLTEWLEAFRAEGIAIEKAYPQPLALFAAYDALGPEIDLESEDDDVTLVADLGKRSVNFAILLNGRLAFARNSSLGGDTFTESLAKSMGISLEDAERLKIKRGGLEAKQGILDDTVAPLRATGGQLLTLIQSTVRLASTQINLTLPPLTRVVTLGGGFGLRGLDQFLAQGLRCAVEPFRPAGLSVEADAEAAISGRPADTATAVGLGLTHLRQAAGAEGIEAISILPGEYVEKRTFRERTVFLYAAGAILVLVLLARLLLGVVRTSEANSVFAHNQSTLTELQSMQAEYAANRTAEEASRSRMNRLLAEAEQSAFQALLLDFFGARLRPELQLQRAWLEPEESSEGQIDYVFHVEGRANNEKRRASSWIREMLSDLESEETVRSAALIESAPEKGGSWYNFSVAIRPNYIQY